MDEVSVLLIIAVAWCLSLLAFEHVSLGDDLYYKDKTSGNIVLKPACAVLASYDWNVIYFGIPLTVLFAIKFSVSTTSGGYGLLPLLELGCGLGILMYKHIRRLHYPFVISGILALQLQLIPLCWIAATVYAGWIGVFACARLLFMCCDDPNSTMNSALNLACLFIWLGANLVFLWPCTTPVNAMLIDTVGSGALVGCIGLCACVTVVWPDQFPFHRDWLD